MPHTLVVVESPTKSKTIKRYLDSWSQGRFQVTSSVGHIIDLPEKVRVMNVCGGHERSVTMSGMRTALPYLDHFLPAHSLESLLRLSNVLAAD